MPELIGAYAEMHGGDPEALESSLRWLDAITVYGKNIASTQLSQPNSDAAYFRIGTVGQFGVPICTQFGSGRGYGVPSPDCEAYKALEARIWKTKPPERFGMPVEIGQRLAMTEGGWCFYAIGGSSLKLHEDAKSFSILVPDVHVWESRGIKVPPEDAQKVLETYNTIARGNVSDNVYDIFEMAVKLAIN